MNFLSDAETDDRESVIKNGQSATRISVNQNEAVRTKSVKRRSTSRNIHRE